MTTRSMQTGDRVAVVVPARNEAALLPATLRSIPPWVAQVVVVDDGSVDGTADVAREVGDPRVHVVRHPRNLGVGAAIATGYRSAFGAGADVVAVMAGDAQMDPGDLAELVAPALAGEAGYVKGNRLAHAEVRRDMPWARWVANLVLSLLTRIATGLDVRDSQCGYTVITRDAAARLPLDTLWPRYGYPNDLLGMIASRGVRMREVTVRAVYGSENSGVRWWHAVLVIPALLVRAVFRRVLGRASASTALPAAAAEGPAPERPAASADGP